MPTSKTYKKDKDTTIKEVYTLTADRKGISRNEVFENNVLKNRTDYAYDIYGNITNVKNYYDESNYIETIMSYKDGVYLETKTTGNVSESFTYNILGQVVTATDGNGNHTSYEYDALGRAVKITKLDGASVKNEYIVNANQNRIISANELGVVSVYDYDKLGNLSSVLVDGKMIASYVYDNIMRLVESYDASNTKTAYTYDYYNRILTKDIGGLYTETYEYNDVYTPDQSRVVKTIVGDSNAPSVITAAYTDNYGNIVKDSIFDDSAEISNAYSYDYIGNKITDLTARDNYEGRPYSNKYDYDYAGNLTKSTNNEGGVFSVAYDLLGRKTSTTDPKGYTAVYEYDENGRLKTEKLPFKDDYYTIKTYEYDSNGNIVSQRISNNKPGESLTEARTDFIYNNRNWLIKAIAFDGNIVENYTEYSYDKAGNKTEMRTANGTQKTVYEYDNFNRLVKLTDALGQPETYQYDNNGNLTGKTDRNGNVTTNAYDKLNRLTNVSVKSNGVTAPEFMKYTYTKTGALLTEENENLKTSYYYDNFGRLATQLESNGVEKHYRYDLANNRIRLEIIINNTERLNTFYTYDSMNRLATVTDKGVLTAVYTYDKNGNRESLSYPNGVTTVYGYNKANLVTGLVNKNGSTVLSSYTYAYYLDGNQATKTDHDGTVTTYQYDGLGRLTEEAETVGADSISARITKTYEFDKAGNRAQMAVSGLENYVTNYTYDSNNRLLTEKKAVDGTEEISEYTYDPNGNQLSRLGGKVADNAGNYAQMGIYATTDKSALDDGFTYELDEYDVFNRLIGVQKDGKTAKYTYKADGLRLAKVVDGEKTTHIWNGSNIVMDLNGGNAIKDIYYRGIGLIKSDKNGYYLYNAHGDVVQLSNNNGAVTKDYHYDAFGVEYNKDDADNNPFRYCGEYFDKETDTIYLRARYYNPVLGRFTTQDPVRAGLNWYTYCRNIPTRFIDPFGMWETGDVNLSPQAQAYIRYYDIQIETLKRAAVNPNLSIGEQWAAKKAYESIIPNSANDIRALDSKGLVTGVIYNVPLFNQGGTKLCWAFSQVMLEAFNGMGIGMAMTQFQADDRAREIAISYYGDNWNQGAYPVGIPIRDNNNNDLFGLGILSQALTGELDFSTLSVIGKALEDNKMDKNYAGPIYGYYSDSEGTAHAILITGVVSAQGHPSLIVSNNPSYSPQVIQAYDEFLIGYPDNPQGMKLKGLIIPKL